PIRIGAATPTIKSLLEIMGFFYALNLTEVVGSPDTYRGCHPDHQKPVRNNGLFFALNLTEVVGCHPDF
ncbi:MAG: hypothetical protein EAY81_01665, partial [Bacteroidetes bacterium]